MTDISAPQAPLPLSKEELGELWFALRHQVLDALQRAFRLCGLTQQQIGHRIGKDTAAINRCLRGQENMTLRTMHEIARGMDYRLKIELEPLSSLRQCPPSRLTD